MPMKTTVAAIDFGTNKIVTLVAENSGSQRCDIIAAGVAKYDGYLTEGWNNPGQLDEAIRQSVCDAEEQAGSACLVRPHPHPRRLSAPLLK